MILLDTHVLVWVTTDKSKLSSAAAEAIRSTSRTAGGIAIAGHTLWEIALISTKNKIRLPSTLSNYLRYVEAAFTVLPMTGAIAESAMSFGPDFPGDPADRVITATALVHGLRLVTKDKPIRNSNLVDCIW